MFKSMFKPDLAAEIFRIAPISEKNKQPLKSL